ncbi:MAG: hypothetical protein RSE13_06310 [Planktothrix sp. GU0601_MAG3]|nr:MAG: hypothetical protein RSE13_06310 [Planktothrix sp. GU0601_MAG3]
MGVLGLVGYPFYRGGKKAVEDIAKSLMLEIGDRIDKNPNNYWQKP